MLLGGAYPQLILGLNISFEMSTILPSHRVEQTDHGIIK